MESKVPGSGDLNFQLSFRQESRDVLKMTCKMRATGDALQYFPETRNISINGKLSLDWIALKFPFWYLIRQLLQSENFQKGD